jgi:hypothetical protein
VIEPMFVAPDGDGEPTIWRGDLECDRPAAVLRRCDLPAAHRDLWERFVAGIRCGEYL